jgi:hypothetical protein
MTDALARLVREKLFSVLVEVEDIEDGQLTRIARDRGPGPRDDFTKALAGRDARAAR